MDCVLRRPKRELAVVLGGSPKLLLRHSSQSTVEAPKRRQDPAHLMWARLCAGAHALLSPVSVLKEHLAISHQRLQALILYLATQPQLIVTACFAAVLEVFRHPRRHGDWRAATRQRSRHRKARPSLNIIYTSRLELLSVET